MKQSIVSRAVLFVALSAVLMGCSGDSSTPAYPVAYDDRVAEMMAGVEQTDVATYIGNLSGESPIVVGGETVTLTTRNTLNAAATRQATQYVFEFMQAQDLDVQYEDWTDTVEEITGRNVAAQIDGTVWPDEIVLITAHLDCMPEEGPAPGADDNASGSVGVMLTAARLAGYSFERTIRFVLFTGEEYGPSGSQAYAAACAERDENILGVLNLDVIGWDDNDDGVLFLFTRNAEASDDYEADEAIANAFADVIDVYALTELTAEIEGSLSQEADTQSFWDEGYPAILAIEDEKYESNPNWHEPTDVLATLNLPYCTHFIKAAVGTVAHMAVPAS